MSFKTQSIPRDFNPYSTEDWKDYTEWQENPNGKPCPFIIRQGRMRKGPPTAGILKREDPRSKKEKKEKPKKKEKVKEPAKKK